jgi:hypothetical protein
LGAAGPSSSKQQQQRQHTGSRPSLQDHKQGRTHPFATATTHLEFLCCTPTPHPPPTRNPATQQPSNPYRTLHPTAQELKRQGKLSAEADAHSGHVAERDRTIRSLASTLALPLPAAAPAVGPLSEAAAAEFREALAARAGDVERNLKQLKEANRWGPAGRGGGSVLPEAAPGPGRALELQQRAWCTEAGARC